MKKFLTALLTAAMVLSMTACEMDYGTADVSDTTTADITEYYNIWDDEPETTTSAVSEVPKTTTVTTMREPVTTTVTTVVTTREPKTTTVTTVRTTRKKSTTTVTAVTTARTTAGTKKTTKVTSRSTGTNATVVVPKKTETGEDLVWVPTNGGTKYHKDSSCSKMKDPIQVTRKTAEANGYTPCKRCYG